MNIDQLKYLIDLSKTNSMNITAKRMFITQPAISDSIKRLEHELGCTLLIRSKTGIEFTEDGKKTLIYAQKIVEHYEELRTNLQHEHLPNDLQGKLMIGSAPLTTDIILPNLITKMHQLYPKITLYVQEYTIPMLLIALSTKQLDFGLFAFPDDLPPEMLTTIHHSLDILQLVPLYSDKMVCVMSRNNPLSAQPAFSYEELVDYKKTMCPGFSAISEAENCLHVSNNPEIHQQFMREEGTICPLPYQTFLAHYAKKEFICRPITDAKPSTNYLAYRKENNTALSMIQKTFIENIFSLLLDELT